MKQYDLIVVGSGPGGSAAARQARRRGLSVALIDKKTFPRDKLCGGLFTGRSQKAMHTIFEREVDETLFLTSKHMRFSANGDVLADITDAPAVHLTMRRDLDEVLHKDAVASGAVAYLGQPLTEIDESLKTVTLKDGTKLGFEVLVGADSVNSMVARILYGRAFDPETIGFGLEIETPLTPERDGAVEVDFDAAEWGYGWSFPKRQTVTVGVGGINSENADMKANMAAYVDLTSSDDSLRYKGQYLPFGDYRKSPGRGPVVLVGDAAGLVDPITGEGIALAMESGAHAADAAADAMQAGDPSRTFGLYMKRVKPIHRSLTQARQWRMIMFPKIMQANFKRAFKRGNSLQRKYLELLAGEAEYNDLRGALLKRIPKILWASAHHKIEKLFLSR